MTGKSSPNWPASTRAISISESPPGSETPFRHRDRPPPFPNRPYRPISGPSMTPGTDTMPRYFFNTRIGEETIADDEGAELRDADQAWEVARAMIVELLEE